MDYETKINLAKVSCVRAWGEWWDVKLGTFADMGSDALGDFAAFVCPMRGRRIIVRWRDVESFMVDIE